MTRDHAPPIGFCYSCNGFFHGTGYTCPKCAGGRKKHRGGKGSRPSIQRLIERDGLACHLCGQDVRLDVVANHPWAATRDHVIPLSVGGGHKATNLRVAHYACNITRGNHPVDQIPLKARQMAAGKLKGSLERS